MTDGGQVSLRALDSPDRQHVYDYLVSLGVAFVPDPETNTFVGLLSVPDAPTPSPHPSPPHPIPYPLAGGEAGDPLVSDEGEAESEKSLNVSVGGRSVGGRSGGGRSVGGRSVGGRSVRGRWKTNAW